MYTEERKGSLLKSFILKLILIIIFVLLLIWLVPWPNMNAYIDALNPLKDQIFNANIQEMKNAAITYYTTERLPENVGDVKKMTLQEMLDMKLLIPFVDKNGDSCDVTASYVSLEKKETEYLMKVNLKCGEEENYILVHLGCYSYCSTDICEAQPEKTEKPSTTPVVVRPTATTKPTSTTKPTVKPTTTPTVKPTVTPTVTPTTKPTTTPTVTPTATPTVTPVLPKACEVKDGKYYGKSAKEVTFEVWKKECTTTPTQNPVKEYEYKKYTAAYCGGWSNWTTSILKNGETLTLVNNIYKVVEDLGTKKVQVGTLPAVYEKVSFTYPELYQVGTHDYKVCTEYKYIVTGNTITQINGDWYDSGQEYRGYNPPADPTATAQWLPVGVDYDVCGETCANHPYTIWHLYKRSGTNYSTEASVTATCTKVETRSIPTYITRQKTVQKKVLVESEQPLYANRHFYRTKTCTNVVEAKTSYVWSSYNDTNLLKDGYTYTGKTRNK